MNHPLSVAKPGPGRPRKFGRPARAVTVTLPDDVLARLHAVDADLGTAIVRVVDKAPQAKASSPRPTEITTYGNHAVIVVTPLKALRRLAGVELVPIGNGRALISLEAPQSVSSLELALRDALAASDTTPYEREALQDIADVLRDSRSKRGPLLRERTIIVLEARRSRPVKRRARV